MIAVLLAAAVHTATTLDGVPVHTLTIPAGALVRPVARRPGRTVPGWLAAAGGMAAINGGYFNHSDGWPVSRVVARGVALTDPAGNKALTGNSALKPHLDTIMGKRSAWFAGPVGWLIAPWHQAPSGYRDALQAGPALLPAPRLEAEAFVLRDARGRVTRDGIGSGVRAARSGLGLRPDGSMVWLVAGSPGLSITGLAAVFTRYGCVSALALDGGSSSTLSWTEGGKVKTFVGNGGAAALVNSALVLAE